VRLARIRKTLVSLIKRTSVSPTLREKCIALLFRFGMLYSSTEDLLLAANFQYKYEVDLREHLEFFTNQGELFRSASTKEAIFNSDHGEWESYNENQRQGTVEFPGTNRT
jgi:hypothetical protein